MRYNQQVLTIIKNYKVFKFQLILRLQEKIRQDNKEKTDTICVNGIEILEMCFDAS